MFSMRWCLGRWHSGSAIAGRWITCLAAFFLLGSASVSGQGIVVSSPFNTINDSYYENFGVNFGFHLRNGQPGGSRIVGLLPNGQINPLGIVFNQGNSGAAIPPFGNYDPGANANFGFGVFGSGGGFSLGLSLGKGSTRTGTNQTPMVTVPNGGIGGFNDGNFRPFVTSVTPFTFGNGYTLPLSPPVAPSMYPSSFRTSNSPSFNGHSYNAIRAAMAQQPAEPRRRVASTAITPADSSAQHGDISVKRIKAQREQRLAAKTQANAAEIRRLTERGESLLTKGDKVLARVQFYKAYRLAEGDQKKELKARYDSLRSIKR